jgi:hypothetical protein
MNRKGIDAAGAARLWRALLLAASPGYAKACNVGDPDSQDEVLSTLDRKLAGIYAAAFLAGPGRGSGWQVR